MRCPLLAVRRRLRGPAAGGWSLVLPARWVMPVWQALAFAGACAAGQREWHWAATDQVPAVPWTFTFMRALPGPVIGILTLSRPGFGPGPGPGPGPALVSDHWGG